MTTTFDGPTLAHAWLAVFAAASTDAKGPVQLYKTIAIEQHPTGVRLLATDRFILLTAWAPDLEHMDDAAPTIDQAPERVVVAYDGDGRGRSILGYVCSLASQIEDYAPGKIDLDLEFDVHMPGGGGTQEALDGMDPTYVVLSMPDVEKVYLQAEPTPYPDWRGIIGEHTPIAADTITLNPEVVERLTKIRKHASGSLAWVFGGEGRAALVSYRDSFPLIHGAVMPMLAEES